MADMSTTHTHTDLLDLADDFAERIRAMTLPSLHPVFAALSAEARQQLDLNFLTGDALALMEQLVDANGLVIPEESVVVWYRTDDRTVVVWGGNEYDYDMNRLAEVKL